MMLLTWSPSKLIFIGACASLILLAFVIDAPWTEVIRSCLVNVILYPIIAIIPTSLKHYVLSTSVVGAGFNCFVYLGVNFPIVWQVASESLLSSKTRNLLECPPGMVAITNPSHFPSSNGCGADAVKIDKIYLSYEEQEACCNQHDICYDTCHSHDPTSKSQCDVEFKACLDRICTIKGAIWAVLCPLKLFLPNWIWEEQCEESIRTDREKKCKASAHVLYKFVDGLGSSAYDSAQNVACICVPEKEAVKSSVISLLVIGLLIVLLIWFVTSYFGRKYFL